MRAPFLKGMRCRFLDRNLREIGAGSVRDGGLKVPSEKPVFSAGQIHVDGETVRRYDNGALAEVKGNSRSRYVAAAIQRDRSK